MFKHMLQNRSLLALAALLLASLACNLPSGVPSGSDPTPTEVRVPVSTEAVEDLRKNLEAAATEVASSQEVSLVVTQEQLTSLVAFEMQSQENPVLNDPQVILQNGQAEVLGTVNQGGISAPARIVLTVSADDQGKPDYQIVEGRLGPLPIPDSMLDSLSNELDTALADLGPRANEIFIEDISIGDGVMTITGRKVQ